MEAITQKYAAEHLKAAHQILHAEHPLEIRVISKDDTVLTGIFDEEKSLTFWINEVDCDDIKSWYWSYNALKPEIVVTNKLERGFATGDSHYESRRFFYIDIDPEKAGDMATDEEVSAATATKDKVLAYLVENGFSPSMVMFTGNGYAIFIKTDCWPQGNPNYLVGRFLKLLSDKFSTKAVTVDTCVHNISRLVRIAGLPNRKGEPARLATVLSTADVAGLSVECMKDFLTSNGMDTEPVIHFYKNGDGAMSEDFDRDEFFTHVEEATGVEVIGESFSADNVLRHVLSGCIFNDHRRMTRAKTVFLEYPNGDIQYDCKSEDCEGLRLKDVLAQLSEIGEPYPYPVWKDAPEEKWNIEDVETDANRVVTAEELFGEETPFLEPVNEPTPVQVEPAKVEKPEDPLKMPEDAMYGTLGQMAHDMKMPLGLAYPALLTCYSAKVIHDEMDNCRLNLYTCLIANKGGGKDQARYRALVMLDMSENTEYMVAVPASDRGIQVLFGDQPAKKGEPRVPGPRRMLLVTEEIEEILKKGSIDKSGMFQTFCTLWDGNTKTFADRTGKSTVNCRLSWLGGIPLNADSAEKFSEIWGETSTHGLLSRFLLGYSGVKWNYRKWSPPPIKGFEQEIDLGGESVALGPDDWHPPTLVEKMSPEAEAFYEAWESTDESGRDKYHLHKVALLTASANDEKVVSLACMEAAARFMAWQARLHEVFKPGIAANYIEAKASERILDTLRRKDARGETNPDGYIAWRRVSHDNKWTSAFGANLVARVISGLIECGELKPLMEESKDGKKEKVNKNYVRVTKVSGGKSPMGNVVPPNSA